MITLDGNGISAIIIACGGVIVTLGTFGMTVMNWKDSRELKRLSINRDAQIKEVKDLVNGKSEQLQTFVAKEAYEKGREHERLAPGTPSPDIGVTALKTVVTAITSTEASPPSDDKAA